MFAAFFFFFFNSVGLLLFLCSRDIIVRIAERSAAVLMNMINEQIHYWTLITVIILKPGKCPCLLESDLSLTFLTLHTSLQRSEQAASNSLEDQRDVTIWITPVYCTSKDELMFSERTREKNQSSFWQLCCTKLLKWAWKCELKKN